MATEYAERQNGRGGEVPPARSSISSDDGARRDALPGTAQVNRERPAIMATSAAMEILPSPLDLLPSAPGGESDRGGREPSSSKANTRKRRTLSVLVAKQKPREAEKEAADALQPLTSSTGGLGAMLLGDVLVAATVTLGVSPFLTVIDKAIVQRAAGTHTTGQSCLESVRTIARNPAAYAKSPAFLMMWGVYALTYSTANCLKTVSEHRVDRRKKPKKRAVFFESKDRQGSKDGDTAGKMGVFLGTSVVNSGASLLKDRAYAKMFGTAATAAPKIPLITYGLWSARDFMVIGSSFVLPDRVARSLADRTGVDESRARKAAQFGCPVATQFVAGPVQLLGLDCYNRPLSGLSLREAATERALCLWRGTSAVVGARVARIAPAYGIGGIGNASLRDKWRDMLARREEEATTMRMRTTRTTVGVLGEGRRERLSLPAKEPARSLLEEEARRISWLVTACMDI